MSDPRKSPIYLKQVYTFQSNQIKFENPKSLLLLIKNLKSKETKNQIKAHLSYFSNSYFYNYKPALRKLRQPRVLRNLRKIKMLLRNPIKDMELSS